MPATVKPPDPDALGKIRNIVRTAHKWGGDGRKPSFRKIRRVMVAKHSDVIAKAFGGDPDTAAGWIKTQWYRIRGRAVPGTRGKAAHKMASDTDDLVIEETGFVFAASWNHLVDEEMEAELLKMDSSDVFFFESGAAEEAEDGLIEKVVLRTGTWAVRPDGSRKPFTIDKQFLAEVVEAFEAGAWPHVTVPFNTHDDDDLDANTGFVKKLRIAESPVVKDQYELIAGLDITEPDVRPKVLRGTIANVSVFVDMRGVISPDSGRVWPKVLKHICLTNRPFVSKLRPFGKDGDRLAAMGGDGAEILSWLPEDDVPLPVASLADDFAAATEGIFEARKGDVKWNDAESLDGLRHKIDNELGKVEYRDFPNSWGIRDGARGYVQSMAEDSVLVKIYTWESGDENDRTFVAGWEKAGGGVVVDPPDEWIEVAQRWVQLSITDEKWPLTVADDDEIIKAARAAAQSNDKERVPMPDEKKETTGGGAAPETLSLTRDELNALVAEQIQAEREKTDQELATLRATNEATTRALHEARVAKRIDAYNQAKYPPALIARAKAIMDADSKGEGILKLTLPKAGGAEGETEERMFSATGIVELMMEAIPVKAVDATDPAPQAGFALTDFHLPPKDQEDVQKRADSLADEIGLPKVKVANGNGAS